MRGHGASMLGPHLPVYCPPAGCRRNLCVHSRAAASSLVLVSCGSLSLLPTLAGLERGKHHAACVMPHGVTSPAAPPTLPHGAPPALAPASLCAPLPRPARAAVRSAVLCLLPRWWRRMAKEHNDYFQWCSQESIAVGGAGGCVAWQQRVPTARRSVAAACMVAAAARCPPGCPSRRVPVPSACAATPAPYSPRAPCPPTPVRACRYALWLDADLTRGISRNSTTFGNASLAGEEEFAVGAVELWGLS